jgi:hypothetical protein
MTFDNRDLLLTQNSLLEASNRISAKWGRVLTKTEVELLVKTARALPADRFANRTYSQSLDIIGQEFAKRNATLGRPDTPLIPGAAPATTGIDGPFSSEENTLEEYQQGELMQLTPDESAYATRAHADRRGNARVDRERVNGSNSAPHGLPPQHVQQITAHQAMLAMQQFLNPDSISDTVNRLREGYHRTLFDIELARQTIQLDSRYRLPIDNPYEWKWNLHNAGTAGKIGDVRTQDTLQQIISMQVGSLWLPLPANSTSSYYGRVRLLVRELLAQSIQSTQFLNPLGSPTATDALIEQNSYHWEFNIEQIVNGRARLVPINEKFMFRKPVARLETITLQWRTPYELLTLPIDRETIEMTFGNPTQLGVVFPLTHNLINGDLVYILNSNCGNATLDAALTQHYGYIVTVIDPQTFSIAIDASAVAGTQPVTVYYGSKRASVQIDFLSLQQ